MARRRSSTSSSPPATSTTTPIRRAPRRRRAPTSSPSSARPRSRSSTTSRTARPPRATAAPSRRRRTSASCARRSTRSPEARALHPADELLVGPVHGGDRLDGRGRAARHAAQRRDVRHPLPRHQHVPHVRRSVLLPAHHRARGHHHQHRRGQLPHHRRRRREGAHRPRLAVHQRGVRQARRACQTADGLGHAYEIDPSAERQLLLEIARRSSCARSSPTRPIKWMPPTKHKTGDIFFSHVYDAMFDLVAASTRQSIELLGMMTEAIHTPLLADRYVALKSAPYVFNARARHRRGDHVRKDGRIVDRAREVLGEAHGAARGVPRRRAWWRRSRAARFADVKRPETGGKGLAGRGREGARLRQPDPRRARRAADAERSPADPRLRRSQGRRASSSSRSRLPVPALGARRKRRGGSAPSVGPARRARRRRWRRPPTSYTFFVVYGRADVTLDSREIEVPEMTVPKLGFDEIEPAHRGRRSAGRSWSSAPAPAPTRTPSASTPSST